MIKQKSLTTAMIILVSFMGSVPGLLTLFVNVNGPFQRPDGPYWMALVIGIPSILAAILLAYYLSKYFLRLWLNENKAEIRQSLVYFLCTILVGLIAVLVAWEVNWIIGKISGWGGSAEVDWLSYLKGIPIMFFFSIIPITVISLFFGLFSYFYLRKNS